MSLPQSFVRAGFKTATQAAQARTRVRMPNGHFLKPLLIGTEGETNTGKTEFILSCPGPGILIAIDRGFDGVLDNTNPPQRNEFAWDVIQVPMQTAARQADFVEYWNKFRQRFYDALDIPDCCTVAIDCDSDSWELERLAEFGKLANVWPQTRYGDIYAKRRALLARAWDSGKVIVGTNKVKSEFETVYKPDGTAEKEQDGTDKKRPTGRKTRQGFPDQDYLWQIQLRHTYNPARVNKITGKEIPATFGITVLKCKHNRDMEGFELTGEDCNFQGLVSALYPEVDPASWGM